MCLSLVRHCTGAPYDKRASSRVLLGLPFGSEGAGGQACGAGVRGGLPGRGMWGCLLPLGGPPRERKGLRAVLDGSANRLC